MRRDKTQHSRAKLLTQILSVLFIAIVIAVSVVIYVYREKVQELGSLGYIGVFVLCFLCNATVLAPAPSLMVVVSAALVLNPLLVALFGSLGITLGEAVGYSAGYMGKNVIDIENNKLAIWVKKRGAPVIFLFAFLPLPVFDVIGLASGFLKIPVIQFLTACFLGKFIKLAVYTLGAGYFVKYMHI